MVYTITHSDMSAAHTYRAMAMGVFVGFSLVSCTVYAWSGPGATPPNGNVEAPVNVGSSAQSKTGGSGYLVTRSSVVPTVPMSI